MTREEAIEQLQICKDLIKQNGQDYLDERDIPLLDMAIEALELWDTTCDFLESAKPMPSAEPVHGEWIPCSERLPDVGQDVIFCDEKWTEEGCLRADGDWWQFRWSTVRGKEEITAWMPLPEPYKGGDTE